MPALSAGTSWRSFHRAAASCDRAEFAVHTKRSRRAETISTGDQIADPELVVFNGYATLVKSLVGHVACEMENPNLGPLEDDCDAANQMLGDLG